MPPDKLSERVPALIDLVGLTPHIDKRLQNFSKGMLQRIGLAQALIHEPEMIFLDEPTSGLDPMGRRMVRDIIRAQRDRGATVFLNSHLLSEIEITCDQVVFIREGEVVTSRDMRAQQEEAVRVEVRARKLSPECVCGPGALEHVRAGGRRALTLTTRSPRVSSRHPALSGRRGRRCLPVHAAAAVARRTVHQHHGRGSRTVMGVWIMAGITFREAARKKILWTALLAGVAFSSGVRHRLAFSGRRFPELRRSAIFALPDHKRHAHDRPLHGRSARRGHDHPHLGGHDLGRNYLRNDSRHRHQASRPLANSDRQVAGIRGDVGVYVAIMFGGTIAEGYWIGGVMAQHPVRGALLVFLECIVALSVTFMFGTWFSTLTSGVIMLGLLGVAFLGGWLEQMSGFTEGSRLAMVGIVSSLIMPSEAIWRRAAFEMESPLAGSLQFSPFADISIPSVAMIGYACVYLSHCPCHRRLPFRRTRSLMVGRTVSLWGFGSQG